MTWIETHAPGPDQPQLAAAMREAMHGYPSEYSPARAHEMQVPEAVRRDSIVGSHSLAPEVLRHVFAGFRAMLSPELPLGRRQHEMIATVVSALNHCHY